MSIEITFTGETLLDLAQQADTFAAGIIGAELRKNTSKTNVPPSGERKPRKKAEPTGGEPIVPRTDEEEAEDRAEAPKVEPSEKQLKEMKENALDLLRSVYVRGEAGQKAVTKLTKSFGVKKAADVPVEKAEELLSGAKKLDAEITDDPPV